MLAQLQDSFAESLALRRVATALLAVLVGAVGGLVIAAGNPVVPFAVLGALIALPRLLTRPMFSLLLVICTVTLLPFAVLPVRLAVLTPTLLEIGLLLLYMAWTFRALSGANSGSARTPLDLPLLLFLGCTIFAFVLGIARDPSTEVIHNYAKLLLSAGLFFAVGSLLRNWRDVRTLLRGIVISGAIQAFLGIVLWRLPDTLAGSLLQRLSVVGYPTDRVIRYIEDNPTLGERAVGTQVDPNSYGGLLVVIAIVTGVCMLARTPVLKRPLLGAMLLLDVSALVLTQSRQSLVGVVVAFVFIGVMRYRKLLGWGLVGGVVLLASGVANSYVSRLVAGLLFQDQANRQRLGEYSNALAIISQYPAFGVGFGSSGELDLSAGVSSIYLAIAERTGLLGTLAYALVMIIFFAVTIRALITIWRERHKVDASKQAEWSALDSGLLAGVASAVGMSTVGLADHYYFNIQFPHMVAIFWLMLALALAARRLLMAKQHTGGVARSSALSAPLSF